MIVRRRRDWDKLNHFERWAVAITRHLAHADRLSYLRAVLPTGLIGDHAMSRLERLPALNPDRTTSWPYGRSRPDDHDLPDLRAVLLDPLAHGGHAELNSALKRAAAPARCLLGVHDIAAFLDHLHASARAAPYRRTSPDGLGVVRGLVGSSSRSWARPAPG